MNHRMKKFLFFCLPLVAASSFAATCEWTSKVSRVWTTAGNWSNGVPTSADIALFAAGHSNANVETLDISGTVTTEINIRDVGDYPSVVTLDITNCLSLVHFVGGNNDALETLTGLNTCVYINNLYTGPYFDGLTSLDISALTVLVTLQTTGEIGSLEGLDLSANTSLQYCYIPYWPVGLNGLTLPASPLKEIVCAHCGLNTEGQSDAVLAACVAGGQTGGICILDGNAYPSAQGLADKATLEGLTPPWTVVL